MTTPSRTQQLQRRSAARHDRTVAGARPSVVQSQRERHLVVPWLDSTQCHERARRIVEWMLGVVRERVLQPGGGLVVPAEVAQRTGELDDRLTAVQLLQAGLQRLLVEQLGLGLLARRSRGRRPARSTATGSSGRSAASARIAGDSLQLVLVGGGETTPHPPAHASRHSCTRGYPEKTPPQKPTPPTPPHPPPPPPTPTNKNPHQKKKSAVRDLLQRGEVAVGPAQSCTHGVDGRVVEAGRREHVDAVLPRIRARLVLDASLEAEGCGVAAERLGLPAHRDAEFDLRSPPVVGWSRKMKPSPRRTARSRAMSVRPPSQICYPAARGGCDAGALDLIEPAVEGPERLGPELTQQPDLLPPRGDRAC